MAYPLLGVACLTLVACGDEPAANVSPATTTTTAGEAELTTISASFAGGAVAGGARTETVARGQPVRIQVSGDVDEEIHVHTYDLTDDVSPDEPAVIEFTADIPGVHEVELEGSHLLLLELQVEP